MLCQICFNPKRKVRFHTPRLSICQWCITELCSTDLSPSQVIADWRRVFQRRHHEQLERDILHMERQRTPPPAFPTEELKAIEYQSLNEVSRREGILTYLYRSIIDDSARRAQAQQITAMHQEELLASHREVEHMHAIQQHELESQISRLREESKNVKAVAERDLTSYITSLLAPFVTKSKAVRLLRAHALGLITTDKEILERSDDAEYEIIRRLVRQEDRNQCVICGRSGPRFELHVHHIIPISKSGTDNKHNLVTLCHTCHNRQHPGFQVTRNKPILRNSRRRFVAVDIETTGFSNADAIIEIGAALYVDGVLNDVFHSLVRTKRLVPHVVTRLTGITQGMIRGAPAADVVFKTFRKFIGGSRLVFHNAAFDMRFLNKYADYFNNHISNPVLDTLVIARKKLPGLPSYKLSALTQLFKLNVRQTHRAREDSIATGALYLQLTRIKSRSVKASAQRLREKTVKGD